MSDMTSFERMEAALNFNECDRVPVFPIHHYSSAIVSGIKIGQYATNAETMARCLIAAAKFMQYDGVCAGSDVALEGEACGSIVHQPDNAPAHLVRPVILGHEDLDRLKVPDPEKAGRMPVVVQATRILRKEIGSQIYIASTVMGPMNVSGQLRGIENLMFDSIDYPEFFERLLDFSTEVSLRYAKKLIDAGADQIQAGEALCSPNFISPALYRKFILPRQQRWAKTLMEYGAKSTIIHVCGDITPILEDLGTTGATCIDVDSAVDMKLAKEKAGIAVRGNINPSHVLLQGTKEDVIEAAKKVLMEAKAGGGLILGTGCDVSPQTPLENIKALTTAAIQYGAYDI